jgi:hypothetical protein
MSIIFNHYRQLVKISGQIDQEEEAKEMK